MSIRLKEKITCPKCGFVYEKECFPSVDAAADPELRARVVSGEICVASCPSCKVTTRLIYPCMYQDAEKGFAVYFLPRTESRSVSVNGEMEALMEDKTVRTRRLVDDYTELMEKIAIFENGLDDRVMELFKAYTALSMISAPKDGFKPDTLIFQGYADSERFMMLGFHEKEIHQLSVPKKLYDSLEEAMKGRAWDPGDDFIMVDMLWALDLLKREGSILDKGGPGAVWGEKQ